MKTILKDMEQFFGADPAAGDDAGLLAELAESLPLGHAASIFIADAAGRVEIAHSPTPATSLLSRRRPSRLGDALAKSDCCAFSRRLAETEQEEHGLFGVRLSGAAGGFLGGLRRRTADAGRPSADGPAARGHAAAWRGWPAGHAREQETPHARAAIPRKRTR